jgi:hypothetical protein
MDEPINPPPIMITSAVGEELEREAISTIILSLEMRERQRVGGTGLAAVPVGWEQPYGLPLRVVSQSEKTLATLLFQGLYLGCLTLGK